MFLTFIFLSLSPRSDSGAGVDIPGGGTSLVFVFSNVVALMFLWFSYPSALFSFLHVYTHGVLATLNFEVQVESINGIKAAPVLDGALAAGDPTVSAETQLRGN